MNRLRRALADKLHQLALSTWPEPDEPPYPGEPLDGLVYATPCPYCGGSGLTLTQDTE